MEHVADNIDKMRSAPELKKEYFGDPGLKVEAILNKMVENKRSVWTALVYFQYLVYAGVWKEYKPYYPAEYPKEFKPVKSLNEAATALPRHLEQLSYRHYRQRRVLIQTRTKFARHLPEFIRQSQGTADQL